MGLDTSHNAWHGAYSAFSRWRNNLAVAAGYSLVRETEPFPRDDVAIDWERFSAKNFAGEWDHVEDDALIYLIAHSDCDGVLHPAQAGPLADRLEGLLPKLDNEVQGHIHGMRHDTEQFIRGLRAAVAADEDVDFH
jgi:hypothetical protein